ncbi:MAG: SDR family oxidoreductase [Flavobacteriales bacterium]
MRILVTGTNGLLGQKLVSALRGRSGTELIATSRGNDRTVRNGGYVYEPLDCTDRDAVLKIVQQYRPHAIIHTAAMTNVDACELDPVNCRLQNVAATENLVNAAKTCDAHFIHLSTDFIFDGEAGPYTEDDEPRPLSIYGQSKLDSEHVVMNAGLNRWAIARTIIVYGVAQGLSRSNVVLWAKGALEKGEPIKVVHDQWRMPTLAEDLADGCIRIAEHQATGIFNLCGPDGMSILELVQRVGAFFELDASVINPIDSASLKQPARRPPRTGFVLDKSRNVLGYTPRGFEQGLEILRQQLIRLA